MSLPTYLAYGQNFLFNYGGNGNDEALDLVSNGSGESFVTGYLTNAANYGNISSNGNGMSDVFVAKHAPHGGVIWMKRFGGAGVDRGLAIAEAANGDVLVSGIFHGSIDFDGIILNANGGSQDVFIVRLDNNGTVQWAISEGGSDAENVYGISEDLNGNILITGQFKGNSVLGGSVFNSSIDPVSGLASFDLFIAKYDPNGLNQWVKTGQAPYDDRGLDIDSDSQGNIYVSGEFSDTLVYNSQTYPNTIMAAGFIMKTDPLGNELWFRTMGANQTLLYGLEVDPLNDDVVAVGEFRGQLAVFGTPQPVLVNDTYFYKGLLIRISQAGDILWTSTISSENEVGFRDVIIDNQGSAYAAGLFKCSLTEMADSLGSGIFYSAGYRDVLFTKVDNQGNVEYIRQYGSNKDDYCNGIGLKAMNAPVIAGGFANSFNVPTNGNIVLGNFNDLITTNWSHCGNPNYGVFLQKQSFGQRDVFITAPFDAQASHFDFFIRPPSGCNRAMTNACINQCQDTLVFCGEGILAVEDSLIAPSVSPLFNILWNTGQDTSVIHVSNGGDYSIEMEREDGCYTEADTVHVIINPYPSAPHLTDNFGVNVQAYPSAVSNPPPDGRWTPLEVCLPDSAYIVLGDTCGNCSYVWNSPNLPIGTDTLEFDLHTPGLNNLIVTNQFNCSRYYEINMVGVDSGQNDPINPALVAIQNGVFTDSLEVCQGESIDIWVNDSLNWTVAPSTPCQDLYALNGWLNGNPISSDPNPCNHLSFNPTYTGWYNVTANPVAGWNNLCGTDTTHYWVSDSFFVEVHPEPVSSITLNGPTEFCPNDSSWIAGIWSGDSINWHGPGLLSINSSMDTAWHNSPGTYSATVTASDSTTGCSSTTTSTISISHKPSPGIAMTPADGVICPGDSLLLVADAGISWEWYGPNGNIIGNTQTIYASTPGFYHYVLIDADSCVLTSETAELKEFNTPYLIADPGTHICANGSVELEAITNGTSTFNWLAPLNSTSQSVVVNGPGTYTCEVSQCGFVTSAQITITQSNTLATATLQDSIICQGDSTLIVANAGQTSYEWSNGVSGPSLYVSDTSDYYVTVTDPFGCIANSDTVSVDWYNTVPAPVVSDTAVCFGDSVLLTTNSLYTVEWFVSTSSNPALQSGNTFQTPAITQSTTWYVANYDSVCRSDRTPVVVSVRPSSVSPVIQSPSSVCIDDSVTLFTDTIAGASYFWSNSTTSGPNHPEWTINNFNQADTGYYYLQVSDSFCSSPVDSVWLGINLLPSPTLTVSQDTICQGDYTIVSADTGFSQYNWSNGFPASSPTLLTDQNGPHWVSVTDSNGCFGTSDTIEIVILSLPSPPALSDTSICVGDSVQLSSGQTAIWSGTSGLDTTSLYNTGAVFNPLTLYVSYMDSNSCVSVPDTVVVHPTPGASPTIVASQNYCEGDSLFMFTDTTGISTFQWSGPNGSTSFLPYLLIPNADSSYSGVYSVTTSNAYCSGSDSVYINVTPQPTNVGLTADTMICASHPLSVELNGNTPFNYSIGNSSGWLSYDSPLLIDPADTSHTGWYYSEIDNAGCISSLDSIYVEVTPGPAYPYIGGTQNVCEGDTAFLFLDTTQQVDWLWTLPNGSTSTDPYLLFTHVTTNDAGFYTLTATQFGCTSPEDSFLLSVSNLPLIDLGSDTTICIGQNVTLSAGSGFDDYFWSTGATSESINVSTSGLYHVTIGQGACFASDSIFIDTTNCSLLIPNIFTPNGDGLNDQFQVRTDGSYHLNATILNRWGQEVFFTQGKHIEWDGYNGMTSQPAAAGTYYYVITAIKNGSEMKYSGYVTLIRD